jgi:hypothetical protein
LHTGELVDYFYHSYITKSNTKVATSGAGTA